MIYIYKPLTYLLAVLLVAALASILWLYLENGRLETVVAKLDTALAKQTAAVEVWELTALQRQQEAERALREASKWRSRYSATARSLSQLPLPKEECDALRALVDAARADADRLRQ